MKKLVLAASLAALALSACAPIPNTSQTIIVRTLFDQTTIGGPNYPVVVRGAENVGVAPDVLGRSLRFPQFLRGDSSFLAVKGDRRLVNYAQLDIAPKGDLAQATLTFLHGQRRIGVGQFTLARQDFANPQTVGRISSSMISSMLQEARFNRIDSDRNCFIPNCN